jgi:hypothetical protein
MELKVEINTTRQSSSIKTPGCFWEMGNGEGLEAKLSRGEMGYEEGGLQGRR